MLKGRPGHFAQASQKRGGSTPESSEARPAHSRAFHPRPTDRFLPSSCSWSPAACHTATPSSLLLSFPRCFFSTPPNSLTGRQMGRMHQTVRHLKPIAPRADRQA
ncbi:hypothetical protein BO78DRAFT_398506 [Aspergillus sclerotiicarbonarius CBS 121057]|uniref:Uncharacterized protein n=1 Tax=Aspergillus sclerotiicarbonarius (strain CBS 121057 / IBT 28362) TaxID=1448318 RepID=A0A319EAA4_ASPSB|nr:hypothetical protein BO78DRAFT_398506 [Aspergillus sclerotiicarbonarius CBS 121057]